MKKVISNLEESLEIKTKEADHLHDLVAKMEASPGQDEMNKVQIADLKDELFKSEAQVKQGVEELMLVKKDLRTKDEEIQQREIDISCLRGQVLDTVQDHDSDSESTLTFCDADADSDDVLLLEDLEQD